jgi:hypothetical protein
MRDKCQTHTPLNYSQFFIVSLNTENNSSRERMRNERKEKAIREL